jgi:signal transduction histidine kinase
MIAELLRLLAHDLRNPLAALHSNLGYLASVLQNRTEAEEEAALRDAQISCDGLGRLIDSVEVLAYALNPPRSLDRGSVDAVRAIEEAIALCKPQAESYDVAVVLTPGDPKGDVLTSRSMLTRSLAYLVSNAVQHSPAQGEVTVSVERSDDARVVISVSDRGTSFDAGSTHEAFTPRGQIDSKSTPRGRYGRGLGLMCAQVCADAAGATLSVAEVDSGNRFLLSLPFA